jgi:hypothetical protein
MPLPYAEWVCSGCGVGTQSCHTIEERYSLGLYAGRWCDPCWANSGYRKEGPEGFDPLDAGESYEPN